MVLSKIKGNHFYKYFSGILVKLSLPTCKRSSADFSNSHILKKNIYLSCCQNRLESSTIRYK